ncbi:MAG: caspase family protein, partial [Geminicoccaceae bacterium]
QRGVDTDAFGPSSRRVALVIGNSDYSNDIGRLANPTRDAAAIANALKRTGFEVSLLQDVSREEMLRAVFDFDQALRDTDVGLFYYAGHAVQVNGRNFMIPTEAELNISSSRKDAIADYVALETVEINEVLARMGNAEAKLNIVILDACRNNPFNEGTRGLNRGLAQTAAPSGTFVAYATSPGKVAQDGDSQHSPYTAAIVKNLETPGLKLEDVFKKVRQDVALQTDGEQIPWENSSVFGDFYFAEPLPEPEPEPEQQVAVHTPQPEPEQKEEITTLPPLTAKAKKPELSREDYIEVQRLLTKTGHYHGLITGQADQETRDAIVHWQRAYGLELNGELSKVQMAFMRSEAGRLGQEAGSQTSDNSDFEQLPPLEPRVKKTRPTTRVPETPVKKWNDIIVPAPPA